MSAALPVFEFHDLANIFPLIEGAAFDELANDIANHGVREAIVLFEGRILDGRNRYRAAHQLGTRFATTSYTGPDARAFVMSMNLHRRHLTAEQKRVVIGAELKADAAQSDRAIAAKLKVDHKTVGAVRREAEATGEIPQLNKTTGKDGKTRVKPVHTVKPTPMSQASYEMGMRAAAAHAARQPKPAEEMQPYVPPIRYRTADEIEADEAAARDERVRDRAALGTVQEGHVRLDEEVLSGWADDLMELSERINHYARQAERQGSGECADVEAQELEDIEDELARLMNRINEAREVVPS